MSEITYTIKRYRRAKTMRIIIHPGGSVVVTSPHWVRKKEIVKFMNDKEAWIQEKVASLKKGDVASPEHYKKHKEKARVCVTERVRFFADMYNVSYGRISIKNQKTCWGSCSSKGNLNFNYRIVFLPPHMADYIIVHELCHLKELNHSARFWAHVAQAIPNYREIEKELKKQAFNIL